MRNLSKDGVVLQSNRSLVVRLGASEEIREMHESSKLGRAEVARCINALEESACVIPQSEMCVAGSVLAEKLGFSHYRYRGVLVSLLYLVGADTTSVAQIEFDLNPFGFDPDPLSPVGLFFIPVPSSLRVGSNGDQMSPKGEGRRNCGAELVEFALSGLLYFGEDTVSLMHTAYKVVGDVGCETGDRIFWKDVGRTGRELVPTMIDKCRSGASVLLRAAMVDCLHEVVLLDCYDTLSKGTLTGDEPGLLGSALGNGLLDAADFRGWFGAIGRTGIAGDLTASMVGASVVCPDVGLSLFTPIFDDVTPIPITASACMLDTQQVKFVELRAIVDLTLASTIISPALIAGIYLRPERTLH